MVAEASCPDTHGDLTPAPLRWATPLYCLERGVGDEVPSVQRRLDFEQPGDQLVMDVGEGQDT